MQTTTIDFDLNARRVYTALKRLVDSPGRFTAVECDEERFTVEGRRGWLLSPLSERVRLRVVATGTQSCRVTVESTSRSVLNLLNVGANSRNVQELGDWVRNHVYRLCSDEELHLSRPEINLREPEIKMKG